MLTIFFDSKMFEDLFQKFLPSFLIFLLNVCYFFLNERFITTLKKKNALKRVMTSLCDST